MDCIAEPDLSNPKMQFWYDNAEKYYFCFDDKKIWSLGAAGWLSMEVNPLSESEYGQTLARKSKDDVERWVKTKTEEGFFYDFFLFSTVSNQQNFFSLHNCTHTHCYCTSRYIVD